MNLLAPFGKLYGRIMDLRNLLYDRGALKTYSLGARTVSVGNLTTGGTGKTPLVALIAEILAENGEKVCVLTRGYGREKPRQRVLVSDGEAVLADARTGGDEPVELAQKLIGKAVIVADADRVAAAKWAREKFGITVFILDDGFQHRRAKRDLDIACIDATNPCGNGRILPAGILRESFKSLKRADAIVITRTDQVKDTTDLERRLKNRNGEAAILRSSTRIAGLINLDGNPENFFATLRTGGFKLSGTRAFRDHHRYTQLDIEHLERTADQTGAIGLIITAKDAVKLADLKFKKPCYVVVAEMVIADPTAFRALVLSS
jgi:tetraacyldisaccharide 4'-kinase